MMTEAAHAHKPDLTRNQSLVLARLEAQEGPLSAYQLLDLLREDGFRAPLQVYRALDRLVRDGYVHRLESLNAFVACSGGHAHDPAGAMTAFAICETCGQVVEICDDLVSTGLDELVARTGFTTKRAVLEFRGTCAACAAKAA